MRMNHFLDVIYTHTEGAPTCIIHSGITWPPGSSILEKLRYAEANLDWLRRAIMLEPRGHKDMYGVFLVPPSQPGFDAGVIWMDNDRFMNMCGHGTIGVAMAMVANGLVKATPPLTTVRLETTVGPVIAEVASNGHTVESCRFHNVPAFVQETGVPVDLGEYGAGTADILFGGNFFGHIHWDRSIAKIQASNAHIFRKVGASVKKQLNEKIKVRHPIHSHIDWIDIVTFYHEPDRSDATYRNIHIFGDGQAGRSPGGTGVSAMVALLAHQGKLGVGGKIMAEGPLGGVFEGELLGEEILGDQKVLASTVKGRANIYGYGKWLLDPDDLVGAGFLMT